MKAGRLRNGKVELEELEPPTAGAGEVTVDLAACGVCGTDLEKLRGNYASAGKIGHEPVGRIRSVGDGVAGPAVGTRVFVHHHVPCYACEVCQRGDLTFCPNYAATNIEPGGFAESFRVPAVNVRSGAVLALPHSVSWEAGALLEPAGCALTALRRCGFRPGDSLFVIGLGPVGLLYARVARASGAGWIGGAELSEIRRAASVRGGVDTVVDPREPGAMEAAVRSGTRGNGVDVSVVATGSPEAIGRGAMLARRGGTLNLFGLPEKGSHLPVDLQELYLRGVRVMPTYATTERDLADVLSLLGSRRLLVDDLVSHRIPLERLGEAFEVAGRPQEALKVVVTGPAWAPGR
ncbi:MAG: alcohol dehydrogenase catalytic domain-containing protein [Thermoplasmata archaeon]|nr:alcohol dehydrogenase catalytic domain-containing protein [Thermoplasmata archaeon]